MLLQVYGAGGGWGDLLIHLFLWVVWVRPGDAPGHPGKPLGTLHPHSVF